MASPSPRAAGRTPACARGRCGHTARILVDLCRHAGLEARIREFPRHVVAEVCCDGRWVVADADGNDPTEIAWVGGGGGNSYWEAAPPWTVQDSLVGQTWEFNNFGGRGVPDIAADAEALFNLPQAELDAITDELLGA